MHKLPGNIESANILPTKRERERDRDRRTREDTQYVDNSDRKNMETNSVLLGIRAHPKILP